MTKRVFTATTIFNAIKQVSHPHEPIFIVFDNPTQFEMFSKLCGLDGFQDKNNCLQFRYKMEGQSLILGEPL